MDFNKREREREREGREGGEWKEREKKTYIIN